ncbi:MAG: glycosyltransferase family 4 protein [Actinomycetota bacterium]|nr:glycosyltransferase family 4 protein [Actinomycetota bacterium]MEE3353037.1 glycosyltransferase family 4 protein [Actinomycetota bacterium]
MATPPGHRVAPVAVWYEGLTVRLLILTPHFRPDSAPTGEVVSSIVEGLVADGHDVHVVTSLPWYRDHRIEADWRGRLMRRGNYGAATVTRLHPFPTNKRNLRARAMGFVGLTGLATLVGLVNRGPFDGVVAVSPPLTFGVTGWLLARRHRCPLVFNVQDVFPDVAVEVGAIRSALAIRFFRWMERATYRRADAVTVLSEDLATNVVAKLTGSRSRSVAQSVGNRIVRPVVKVIPNFVDVDTIRPASRMTEYRIEHGLGDRTVVMYAGNLGHSQSLDLVIGAADRHRDRPNLVYVLNGGGVRADEMRGAAKSRSNLVVVDYQPRERVSEVLASADVHLVPLRNGLGASSVPSKIYSILAAGRPVVASVDEGSEVARVVSEAGAGLAVPPDDLDALVRAVEDLVADPEARAGMGDSGRRWAEAWRSPRQVALTYAELIAELAR